jgi:pyrimidine operon attenuation protein/uracil phosphoribosyltransferase
MSAKQVLDGPALLQKIRRIAFQIYENNFEETEIVIAGIVGEGFAFAELLCEEIKSISKIKAIPVKIDLNKEQPYERPVKFEGGTDALENTGRTFSYSLAPFLSMHVKRIQVAVIVDRNYKRFPISADYKGYELSTTLSEHVQVILSDPTKRGVYLA